MSSNHNNGIIRRFAPLGMAIVLAVSLGFFAQLSCGLGQSSDFGKDDLDDTSAENAPVYEGVAVTLTGDSLLGALAVADNGEIMAAINDYITDPNTGAELFVGYKGVIWYDPASGNYFILYYDSGSPVLSYVDQYLFFMMNFSSMGVDMAVLEPESLGGQIETARSTPYMSFQLFNSSRSAYSLYSLGGVFRSAAIGMNLHACTLEYYGGDNFTSIPAYYYPCTEAAPITGPQSGNTLITGKAGMIAYLSQLGPADETGLTLTKRVFESEMCTTPLDECIEAYLAQVRPIVLDANTDVGDAGMTLRLAQGSLEYGSGDIQVTLAWDTDTDVDLHVFDPNFTGTEAPGTSGDGHIYFAQKTANSGGKLDVDDINGLGPENIYWNAGAAINGNYRVYVFYWSDYVEPPAAITTNYRVLVKSGEYFKTFDGDLLVDGADWDSIVTFPWPAVAFP